MFSDPLFLIAGAAVLVVLLILIIGIGSFARGGDFDRRNANRLMRWRVGAQAAAVVLILIMAWIRRGAF